MAGRKKSATRSGWPRGYARRSLLQTSNTITAVSATSSFGSRGMNNARPRIVVDAMGGDHAPAEIVAGALLAAGQDYADLTLAGDEAQIRPLLRGAASARITILHAPQ